jgi:hypothetical protein
MIFQKHFVEQGRNVLLEDLRKAEGPNIGEDDLRPRNERQLARIGLLDDIKFWGIRALGGAAALGIAVSFAHGREEAEKNKLTCSKERSVHIVTEADVAKGIGWNAVAAALIDTSKSSNPIVAEELVSRIHTEFNPAAGTVQDPTDGNLQLGELVVAPATCVKLG